MNSLSSPTLLPPSQRMGGGKGCSVVSQPAPFKMLFWGSTLLGLRSGGGGGLGEHPSCIEQCLVLQLHRSPAARGVWKGLARAMLFSLQSPATGIMTRQSAPSGPRLHAEEPGLS